MAPGGGIAVLEVRRVSRRCFRDRVVLLELRGKPLCPPLPNLGNNMVPPVGGVRRETTADTENGSFGTAGFWKNVLLGPWKVGGWGSY